MTALIWAAIVGLVVGALAKLIMPGKDPGGVIVTSLLGIAGSVVGNWLGSALGLYTSGAPAGFILSLVGALFLLWAYRMLTAKRAVQA
jgi:uncharacterized membrane protein YeaQ/YmgE (transglycosylase-associated protein family)